jgi:FtsH-binding integral membrane protein
MQVFKLTPKEKERFMKNLPIFFFYYLILFVFFWYGLSHKTPEEIKGGLPRPTSMPITTVIALLIVFYLRCRDNPKKCITAKSGFFAIFGLYVMYLISAYTGSVALLFIITLVLIYINTLIRIKEEFKRKEKHY